jgi:hypothetical protein
MTEMPGFSSNVHLAVGARQSAFGPSQELA